MYPSSNLSPSLLFIVKTIIGLLLANVICAASFAAIKHLLHLLIIIMFLAFIDLVNFGLQLRFH